MRTVGRRPVVRAGDWTTKTMPLMERSPYARLSASG